MLELFRCGSTFSEQSVASITRQLLEALDYCHKSGFMHRDIKPSNVILSLNGNVKLIDFGFAETTSKFHVGTAGTPYYMAPEVIDQSYKDCDIWSLGVLVYVLLTGYRPFDGESREDVLKSVKTGRFFFPEHIELSKEA